MKDVIAAALHFVSCLSPLKGQPTICNVRLICCLLFICVLPQHAIDPDSGRLDFICHPKINDFHKELCFSQYSADAHIIRFPRLVALFMLQKDLKEHLILGAGIKLTEVLLPVALKQGKMEVRVRNQVISDS